MCVEVKVDEGLTRCVLTAMVSRWTSYWVSYRTQHVYRGIVSKGPASSESNLAGTSEVETIIAPESVT